MKSLNIIVCIVMLTLGLISTSSMSLANPNSPGAVYTMSNETEGNEIIIFDRAADGTLKPAGSVFTGGLGTGGGLGNQSGLTLTEDGQWLLVVNAGSDEISVLAVGPDGLMLVDKVWSGGTRPVSITTNKNLVYVLNAGGMDNADDNITGFMLGKSGSLTPIPDSTRALSTSSTAPAQIGFNADGTILVVTEKATSKINTYTLGADGKVSDHQIFDSEGTTPFGFSFGHRNQLFVSEANAGMPNASSVTSYELKADGGLDTISPSVPTLQTAACWLVVTNNGKYAYTTNTGSDSTTGFVIQNDGSLQLLQEDGVSGMTGDAPIDMAFSRNSQFLYVLNANETSISGFAVDSSGQLTPVEVMNTLPDSANGLAAL